MSRSRRFLHGVALGYGYQALVMVTGLWLTPFLLRHLGQHDYGLWLMGLQVFAYLALTDLGITALLPRTVAYATGRAGGVKEATDLPPVIGQTAIIVLGQTVVVGLAALLIWTFFPGKWQALRGPIGLVMAAFTVFFPCRLFAAVLEGLQEQAFVIRATMLAWGISTVANIISILAGLGLYSLAIGSILSQTTTSAACVYRLWSRYREVLPARWPSFRLSEALPQLGRGFWVSASQVGQVLMAGSDILILGKVVGPAMVVPYSCTGKLANVSGNQPQLLMQMAVPGLSELTTGGSRERLYEVTVSLAQGMMLVSGLLACVVLAINEGFVRWWVGPERYAGFALPCLILTQIMIRHFNLTFLYANFCYGYERRIAITSLLDGMVTAAAIWLLTPRFGYLGAATGSIIGVCLVSLPSNVFTLAQELELPFTRLVAPLKAWAWRFGLLAGACVILARRWTPQTKLQMVGTALAVTLAYTALLAQPTLRTAVGQSLRDLITDFSGRFAKSRPAPVLK